MRTRVMVHGGIFDGKMFDLNCDTREAIARVYFDLNLHEDESVTLSAERIY